MPDLSISASMQWVLGGVMIAYVAGMYGLSLWARRRIHNVEDYVVAGRRLPLSLSWATLLATWFGAGTLLTAADEVRKDGMQMAALDPFGAGLCLIIAGLFFAAPLWKMGLLTVADFFRRRFGPRAEVLSAVVLVPSYFGWVAAQFVALAGMLELFYGIDLRWGILLVAIVGTGYTLLGGMWSVTLTDVVQVSLVIVGLIALAGSTLVALGDGSLAAGFQRLYAETPPEIRQPIPTESLAAFFGWLSVLCVGALGNVPGQDLLQRIFSAKSAGVARNACLLAGVAYLLLGLLPILLGLSARILFPEDLTRSILPALAHVFLNPVMVIVFTVALLSAVLSTIDSAILSPATVLAQNLMFPRLGGGISPLALNRLAVVLVAAASLGMAYLGQDAYTLLEDAYELPLVGMFVPLALGLYFRPRGEAAAVASMVVGSTLWIVHYAADWDCFLEPLLASTGLAAPSALANTACALAAYLIADRLTPAADASEASA